jgi:hypothetical protein
VLGTISAVYPTLCIACSGEPTNTFPPRICYLPLLSFVVRDQAESVIDAYSPRECRALDGMLHTRVCTMRSCFLGFFFDNVFFLFFVLFNHEHPCFYMLSSVTAVSNIPISVLLCYCYPVKRPSVTQHQDSYDMNSLQSLVAMIAC